MLMERTEERALLYVFSFISIMPYFKLCFLFVFLIAALGMLGKLDALTQKSSSFFVAS